MKVVFIVDGGLMSKACKYFSRLMPSIICMISIVFAESIDTIHLLKTSPSDSRAVVKMEDGAMKIIKPGYAIGKNGKTNAEPRNIRSFP